MSTKAMIVSFVCCLISLTASGQNVVEQMNEVKSNPDYCYGEGADQDVQRATDLAFDDLCAQLAKKTSSAIDRKKVVGKAKRLQRQRGSQTRLLVYVSLSDFVKSSSAGSLSSQSAQSVEGSPQTLNAVDANAQTTVGQQPVNQTSASTTTVISTVSQPVSSLAVSSVDYAKAADVVAQMKMVKSEAALRKLINTDLSVGLLKECGTAANVRDIEGVYWFVFEKESKRYVAVLSPVKANGMRDNLDTKVEQKLSDYPNSNYGAVWFTLP